MLEFDKTDIETMSNFLAHKFLRPNYMNVQESIPHSLALSCQLPMYKMLYFAIVYLMVLLPFSSVRQNIESRRRKDVFNTFFISN